LGDSLTIPFGSEAVFRLEYKYPEGYGGIAWVNPHRTTQCEFNGDYFRTSRISDEWCHGTGTTYAAISLTDKGKMSTISEVSVRINSDPRQGDLQFGWVSTNVTVNLTFKEKADVRASTTTGGKNKGLETLRELRRKRQEAERKMRFEPVLSFEHAVRKAKEGDGKGLFSLALHYAAGLEIAQDGKRAAKYLEKAIDAKNGNAALVKALMMENNLKGAEEAANLPRGSLLNRRVANTAEETPHARIRKYTGYGFLVFTFTLPSEHGEGLYATNDTAVAIVRSAYKKAVDLGCPFAKDEAARFERHVKRIREEIRTDEAEKQAWMEKVNANARLAQELLGEPPETNPVYDKIRHTAKRDRGFPRDDAETERRNQRETLRQIQETLRKER